MLRRVQMCLRAVLPVFERGIERGVSNDRLHNFHGAKFDGKEYGWVSVVTTNIDIKVIATVDERESFLPLVSAHKYTQRPHARIHIDSIKTFLGL